MPILEALKEYAERTTGLRRPGRRKAADLTQSRKQSGASGVRLADVSTFN
jgi:hypothetical protein